VLNSSVTMDPAAATAAERRYFVPVYPHLPLITERGEGVHVFDPEGRRYLDLYGGHAVAILGYGHPRLVRTLEMQARNLFFQSNAVPLAIRAAAGAALLSIAPPRLESFFLVNSGAEANENALRLAFRRQPTRTRVIAIEGAFHGRTAGAAAITANSARWYAFPRKPFDVTYVPRGDVRALDAAAGNDVAAIICEPVQGQAGAFALGAEFLAAARAAADRCGALLIFDEVQTGMGRLGQPFGAQVYGVTPDVLTIGKGIAGGFPAAALLATPAAVEGIGAGDLGTTFGGGPLACALIEEVIAVLADEDIYANVRRVAAYLQSAVRGVGPVVDVQGDGLLLGLRMARPAKEIQLALLERGILTGGAADPEIVRLLPPLTLVEEHVDQLVAALGEIGR
jgi:acetylornithine/N-succinyldiaminopimelate aminotransferase